ncbi:MAG TPA: putative toxin-antitoxin system toxin component, PIN family [Pyrinomonadaceae bacterium]|nr:putative toxin-antitoxin system toxin component, PIN family [Pyrinomonadaceae bacterium]
MRKNDLRFVLDTNVIVSAVLLPGSTPRRAFDKALDEGKILLSVPTLLELAEVLGRKKLEKYLREEERMRFLVALLKESELVKVTAEVADCRDARDNKFLELAISGKADCIISGDEDLLSLNPYRGIPILSPRGFLGRASE